MVFGKKEKKIRERESKKKKITEKRKAKDKIGKKEKVPLQQNQNFKTHKLIFHVCYCFYFNFGFE